VDTFQFRDISNATLDRMEDCLRSLVLDSNRRDRCTATLSAIARIEPALCDDQLQQALASAANALQPGCARPMPSGAMHDSQLIARKLPMAMLFVPSKGGVSHHWTEDTDRDDLVLGMRVLAGGVERSLS
jgi:N-carbamoyl-L-amino-acid hydrolase